MADNGNRGPNDAFRRSGRRRREPPIIDAAATEVSPDEAASPEPSGPIVSDVVADDGPKTVAGVTPATSESPTVTGGAEGEVPAAAVEPEALASHAPDEPVLFGSAVRDAARQAEPNNEPQLGAEPREMSPPDAVASSETARDAEPLDPQSIGPMPDAGDDRPPPGESAAVLPPPSRFGATGLAGILGVAAVILLGIIGWLVYADGQQGGDLTATVADLKSRVATLEARPDSTALQGQVAALDRRVAAVETDRAGLDKQVAALTARIAGAGQPAQAPTTAPSAPPGIAPTTPGAASNSEPTAAGQPPSAQPLAGPALATAAAVATLATKVQGIDDRLSALSADQASTQKTLAALPKPAAPDFGPVDAKLAALETTVNAVDAKINGSDARLNGFDAKINGIDVKVNGFNSTTNAITARMNGVDAKADDASAQVAKLKSDLVNLPKVDLGPLRAATAALDGRLVKIEGELSAPKDDARVTEARAVGSADLSKATPIALVGQAIQRAIAAGRPYGPEIDALKTLGADPALVARLGPASAGGAPSVDALTAQWNTARDQVLATTKPIAPGAGGAVNRFLAGATSIVQVRRVGAAPGEDTTALASQIDAALGQGDVAAALAAWDKLPAVGKAASQDWADAARGRVDAVGAAGDLVEGAIATLGRPPT